MVKETTNLYEHKCTSACFKPLRKSMPPDLHRVSLGYVYMSSDGSFYTKWGDGEWLSVDGMEFLYGGDGKFLRMFNPTVQLHIHSPGGKTIAKAVTQKKINPEAEYYAQEAAKKRMRKGDNLKEAQRFLGVEATKVIPYAPKKRKLRGSGRGAPGQPRSLFSKQVVNLRDSGTPEREVVERVVNWLREQGESVTPLQRRVVRKRVHYWFSPRKKKSEHK